MKNSISILLLLVVLPFAGCGKPVPPPPAPAASRRIADAGSDDESEYDEAPGLDEEGSREW